MTLSAIFSVTLILFSVIDILGNLPVIIDMKRNGIEIQASVATFSAALIMVVFLLFGSSILGVFGIEVASFALAGSLIILFIGLEMILGIRIFRSHHEEGGSGSIVPSACPLSAGAGTLTTIIALKADYDNYSIIAGILINLMIIFFILKSSDWLSQKISPQVLATLRKTFGILLIAIAIQMFRNYV